MGTILVACQPLSSAVIDMLLQNTGAHPLHANYFATGLPLTEKSNCLHPTLFTCVFSHDKRTVQMGNMEHFTLPHTFPWTPSALHEHYEQSMSSPSCSPLSWLYANLC